MDLSVIVPAYNEQNLINNTVNHLKMLEKAAYACDTECEIIVVNDGSTDRTGLILSDIDDINLINLTQNRGKGYAVKCGFEQAKGKNAAIFDADMAYDPLNVLAAYKQMGEYGVVFGKRVLRGEYPVYRYALSNVFRTLTGVLLKTYGIDSQCGFKIINTDAYNEIKKYLTADNFCFDIQLAYYIKRLKIPYINYPLCVLSHSQSDVRPVHDGLCMIKEVMSLSYKR